jgi:hypothetical protein
LPNQFVGAEMGSAERLQSFSVAMFVTPDTASTFYMRS